MQPDPTSSPAARDARWTQWMAAAQSGDRIVYERLLREIAPFLRGLIRRHCRNAADAEELVQDTLLAVHRVRSTFDPARPFTPWLAAIAARRSIDWLRSSTRRAQYEVGGQAIDCETFPDPDANKEVEDVCTADELAGMLRVLPPRQREAIEALKLRELSLIQASEVSGQSVGALKVNVHRALKTLRALFERSEP